MLSPAAFRLAPDPDDAWRWRERLAAAGLDDAALAGSADAAEVVWLACTQAPYLAALALRDPARLLAAAADPYLRRAKPREVMAAELQGAAAPASDGKELARLLRHYRGREYIRLGARECGLGDPEEVGRELSHLADASLDAAVAFHDAELAASRGEPTSSEGRPRLCVFGMGKLGGLELNFSSDVDLIYVYTTDDGEAGRLTLHEYFETLARRVTRTIGEITEDDVVFRVDLRLRPEGTRGTLTNSLASIERYYESWGRPWERQAWLKARPCAGDLSLGARVLDTLEPFIYPRSRGADVIRDVEELNRKIKLELDGRGLGGGFDVKTGHGGIREIEFFVQALQLIHAGRDRSLRERGTRRALDRLFFAGLVAERERRALADGYAFLRQVEHRIQLESGRQTHRLPDDVRGLETLARRLGFGGVAELAGTLELRTGAVAEIFATLGRAPGPRPEVSFALDPARDREEMEGALASLGFRDAESAAELLEHVRRRPGSPFSPSATGAAARVAPALLEELAASPDPDQALRHAVDLASRAGEGLWALFAEHRPLLRLIATLFGTSTFLAQLFLAHPELIDSLLLRGAERRPPPDDAGARDLEAAGNALRRHKNEEVLRIGLADIAGALDIDDVCAQLTDLADLCLTRTYASCRAALERRLGRLAPMVVLGLGKLGAREMGYASDLDLVFVYDGGVDDHEPMAKLAQRVVGALAAHSEEGRLYEVDTRLRPSGQHGTLVSSLASWREYHATLARLWERQALIRCRAVCGDPSLAAALEGERVRFVYESAAPSPGEIAGEIDRMRRRIETELAHEGPGAYDLKTGRGGLLDVEFAAQYLQLAHGAGHPALRARATLPALAAATAAGLLGAEQHAVLVGGYRFLRRLENRLRIVHNRPIHALTADADPQEMDKLARRCGLPSAGALERAYLAWTRDIRRVYRELLTSTAT